MSHSHEDRVAERPINLCAAYGCPLQGTMSASSGSSDWYCCCHFGQNFGSMQTITAELNRHPALTHAVNAIRAAFGKPYGEWQQIAHSCLHDLKAAQRDDLCIAQGEKGRAWMVRLETALIAACRPISQPAQVQNPLIGNQETSWNQVQFDIPEYA